MKAASCARTVEWGQGVREICEMALDHRPGAPSNKVRVRGHEATRGDQDPSHAVLNEPDRSIRRELYPKIPVLTDA
jgi:hypothetical protein